MERNLDRRSVIYGNISSVMAVLVKTQHLVSEPDDKITAREVQFLNEILLKQGNMCIAAMNVLHEGKVAG